MGPGVKSGAQDRSLAQPRKPDEAPPLYPGADRLRWRRQVLAWVSYIQRRAATGDKVCKSHAATLADLLYAAVHPSYQKIIELEKSTTINFSAPTEKQPEVVQEIVRLIGHETPIETTTRLLTAYKAVHACTRYPNEPIDRFTVRYRGAASHYMDLANVASNSQDSQLLAMVLLENAQLTPDTLQGAKLQLVQQSQQRAALSGSSAIDVAKKHSTKCTSMLDTLLSLPGNSPEDHIGISPSTYILSSEQRETLLDGVSSLNESFRQSDVPHEPFSLQESPTPIFLEDAVLVLQTFTSPTETPFKTVPSISHMAPSLFSNQPLVMHHQPPGPNYNIRRENTNHGNSLKKRTRCHACHRFGHWKGDTSCPSSKRTKNSGNASNSTQQRNVPHENDHDTPHSNHDSGF
jgi:hypothetical protein